MLSVFQKKIAGYAITAVSVSILCVFIVLVFKLFGMFLNSFYYVLLPVAISLILSYMLEPVVIFVSKKLGIKKIFSCILCFVVISVFVIVAFSFGIPYLVSQVVQMCNNFPNMVNNIGAYMSEHAPEAKEIIVSKMESVVDKIVNYESRGYGKDLSKIVSTVEFAKGELSAIWSFIASLAVVPIYLYYMLITDFDFYDWVDKRISFMSEKVRSNILFFLRRFSEIMQSFFRGQLLIASIMGLLFGIGLFFSGVKFGFILGFTAGILNIIPYFGSIIGLSVIIPVALFQEGGGLMIATFALMVFVVVQLIEGYFLTPKIMGNKTGLHPTVIIFSVFFWGTALDGILGMILAIPFSALVVAVYPKLHEFFVDFCESKSHTETEN